jgi:predicted RNA-binding Zn ribbon-like protein
MLNVDLARERADEMPMLGDHLAMDLLNTEARQAGRTIDYWDTPEDVVRWLRLHGIAAASEVGDNNSLLEKAISLRALARLLIEQRKSGRHGDISGLNIYLNAYASAPHLECDEAGELVLTRIARGDALASLLGPVAEAVAQLLVEGDFSLVKQCEHPDCILWFYDRTKAHKRRWCSMAICGNRYKAAQFRKRSGK